MFLRHYHYHHLILKITTFYQVKIYNKTLGEILKPHKLYSIAIAAQFKEYTQTKVIIRQVVTFYMISKESVNIYIREKSKSKSAVFLPAGAFFGEKTPLGADEMWLASCVTTSAYYWYK